MPEEELPSTPTGRKSYKSLKNLIKGQIYGGVLSPHQRLPSMRALSENYKMSLTTVQRAVQELCDESILYAQKGSGTFVAPRRKEYKRIGVLCSMGGSMIKDSIYGPMVNKMKLIAKKEKKELIFFHTRSLSKGLFYYVDEQDLLRHDIDLLLLVNVNNLGFISSLKQFGYPIVAADLDASDIGVHSCYFDNEMLAYRLTQKLIDEGKKKLLFFGGIAPGRVDFDLCLRQRYTGFRLAVLANGLELREPVCLRNHGKVKNCLIDQFKAIVSDGFEPDAIVTEIGGHVLNMLKDYKIKGVSVACTATKKEFKAMKKKTNFTAFCDMEKLGEFAFEIISDLENGNIEPIIKRVYDCDIL